MPYIQKRRIGPPNNHKEVSERRNNKWNHYYQQVAWKKLRDYYMSLHPLCEMCLFNGRSVPAEHCHHRIPFSTGKTEEEKQELLLNPDNLQSLCRSCHEKIHTALNHSKQITI